MRACVRTFSPISHETLLTHFDRNVRLHGDRVFATSPHHSVTWDDLKAKADPLARTMCHYGLKEGRIVLLIRPQSPSTCVYHMASLLAGNIALPVPPSKVKSSADLFMLLQAFRPKLVISNTHSDESWELTGKKEPRKADLIDRFTELFTDHPLFSVPGLNFNSERMRNLVQHVLFSADSCDSHVGGPTDIGFGLPVPRSNMGFPITAYHSFGPLPSHRNVIASPFNENVHFDVLARIGRLINDRTSASIHSSALTKKTLQNTLYLHHHQLAAGKLLRSLAGIGVGDTIHLLPNAAKQPVYHAAFACAVQSAVKLSFLPAGSLPQIDNTASEKHVCIGTPDDFTAIDVEGSTPTLDKCIVLLPLAGPFPEAVECNHISNLGRAIIKQGGEFLSVLGCDEMFGLSFNGGDLLKEGFSPTPRYTNPVDGAAYVVTNDQGLVQGYETRGLLRARAPHLSDRYWNYIGHMQLIKSYPGYADLGYEASIMRDGRLQIDMQAQNVWTLRSL